MYVQQYTIYLCNIKIRNAPTAPSINPSHDGNQRCQRTYEDATYRMSCESTQIRLRDNNSSKQHAIDL